MKPLNAAAARKTSFIIGGLTAIEGGSVAIFHGAFLPPVLRHANQVPLLAWILALAVTAAYIVYAIRGLPVMAAYLLNLRTFKVWGPLLAVPSAILEEVFSCEIGAVRLTEAVRELAGTSGVVEDSSIERAREIAMRALKPLEGFPPVDRLVCVGGSATTAIALLRENRELFSYAQLYRSDLRRLIARLRALDLRVRKTLPGMNPQRADILLAGLLIIDLVFELSHHNRALVSTNDLLLGTLLTPT